MFIDGIELLVLYVYTNGVPGNLGAGFRGLRSGGLAAISKAPALGRGQTMWSLRH